MTKIEEIVSVTKNKTKKIVQWFFSSKKRKLIFSLFLVLLIILPTYFIFFHDKAGASWWNSDWFYRKSIQVTNNTTAENNVYITLTLDTSDTTKFQTDCGDIRFIQSNGNVLPYYIVSGCGTNSTIIHTNFEVFNAGSQNIDFYYGNPTVENGFSSADFTTPASNYTIGIISQEQKGPSPVLYLPMDEGFGSTAHDETSNRNDGTIVGATWKDEADCKNGKCLEFDGNGDYVEINDNPSLDLGEELTLEAWIKPQATNLNNQTILSKIETPSEPTKIYRSVGPSATTAIAVGTTNAMTIIGDRATFATALTDNVGVGDAIQYDDDDDGDIDANDSIVFISSRISNVQYTISNAAGGLPVPVNADLNWSLFRAYTSLANAESGTENTGIDADLVNFDTWSGGKDLVASNEQWNIACYANGTTEDGAKLTVDNWTTGIENFINIYTPINPAEVGISQRHGGKWDINKYQLTATITNSTGAVLIINDDFVRVDGIQIKMTAGANVSMEGVRNNVSNISGQFYLSNSIIRGVNTSSVITTGAAVGLQHYSNSRLYAYNNIIYDFIVSGSTFTTGITGTNGGTYYLYNNTIYNCTYGIQRINGTAYAKNNIVQQNVDGYNGTFDSSSDYNISNLAADAPGANSKNSTTVSFISTTAGSEDFHLSPTDTAAKDSGADLLGDNVFPFNSDIDGQQRLSPQLGTKSLTDTKFDIGADEAQATQIYRSVAPGKTDALETGDGNSLTITGNIATFQRALADNIGVGDVIQYDDDGDGDIDSSDSLAFITGRISNFEFRISNVSGGTPVPVNSDTDWSLFRAYTSLANAETGTENTGIDSDLRNFDTWSGGKDLVASKEQWNIACYANGTTTDTTAVEIYNWTTGVQNFIKIYTPVDKSEVGVSQRHNGKWDNNKYRLETVTGSSSLKSRAPYAVIDGLQLTNSGIASTDHVLSLDIWYNYVTVSNNISKGGFYGISFGSGSVNGGHYIYNNIVYNSARTGILMDGSNHLPIYIYNNNVYHTNYISQYDYGRGIYTGDTDDIIKNNIVIDNYHIGVYTKNIFGGTQSYNITSDDSATGTGSLINQTLNEIDFVSTTVGSEDLHILGTSVARNIGADLTVDPNLPITTDIDGEERKTFDIGADEAVATKIYRSVGPGNTTALATDNAHENTVSMTNGVATFEESLPARIGVGDAVLIDTNNDNTITSADTLLFIHGRNSSLSYDLRTHTGAMPSDITSNDTYQIFRAYTSLANAEAGTKNTSIPVTFNGGNRDLVVNNEEWNVACYGDGVDTGLQISGWITGMENYIKIYTPVNNTEVGISQRHTGKWDSNKYQLVSDTGHVFDLRDAYVKIDGVQMAINASGNAYPDVITYIPDDGVVGNIFYLSNSIMEQRTISGETQSRGVQFNNSNGKMYAWNNILSGWKPVSGVTGAYAIFVVNGDAYIYNNVLYDNYTGMRITAGSLVKNNVSFNNVDDFFSVSTTNGFNNASDDGDGTNPVIPTDWNTVFRDVANKDFRLKPTDTSLRNKGLNLSNDVNLPITSDIEGELRPSLISNLKFKISNSAWDIGADQISGTIHNNYSLNLKTNYPVSNFSTSENDQDNFSSGDIDLEANTWSHLVYKRNADSEELFINGSKKDSGTISNFVKTNNGKLYLGAENANSKNSFKGLLDDVRLYNYARTDSEVKKDTTAGSSGRAATRAAEGVSVAMGDKASSISDGLVGYWKMDEASWNGTANEVKDASGNGNHGVAVSGANAGAGKFGNGGNFDGDGDKINLPNNILSGLSQVTIAGWVYVDSFPNSVKGPWNFATHNMDGRFIQNVRFISSTSVRIETATNDTDNIQNDFTVSSYVGRWSYFAVTTDYVTGRVVLYQDGIKKGEFVNSYNNESIELTTHFTAALGQMQNIVDRSLLGKMDETRIYNRALSPDEIKQLYEYAPGPVLHLKMDEKSGTTAFDSSGGGYNTTLNNAAWENGKIGGGMNFPANTGTAHVQNSSNLTDNWSALTIGAWVKTSSPTTADGPLYISKERSGFGGWRLLKDRNNATGRFIFRFDNQASVTYQINSTNVWPTDLNWHYITVTYDGSYLKMYGDGNQIATPLSASGTFRDLIHEICLGGSWGGSSCGNADNLGKSIDDVKIYNYARTPQQILEDMGGGGFATGQAQALKHPILDLSFDEGQGATAFDVSGNGNNGTLVPGASGGNTTATAMWDKGGKFGGAMEFDGVNDYINSATGSMDSIIRGNVASISMWVKHNSIAQDNQAYFNLRANDSNDYYVRRLSAGGFMRWCQNINGVSHCVNTTNSVNDMNWHHMVFIINGASLNSWYMDGKLQQTIALLNNLSGLVGSANIYVGSRSSSSYQFNGNIDEVKIYNYALGEDEIKTLYNDSSAMVMGDDASRNNNGTAVTGDNKDYCVPGDTAKCDKPVLELSLNEKSGTTAKDSSGNGNNGTLTGGPVWDRGKISGGVSFDGVDDGVNVPNSTPLNFAAGADMTISTWVYPKSFSDSYKSIIWKGTSGVANNYYIKVSNNGRIDYYGGTQSSSGVNFNAWNHISISKTGSNVAYYINGMFAGTAVNNNSGSAPTEPLRIGSDKDTSSTAHFLGSIDEVKIYNYARTPAQIAWDYNQGAPIDHWTFNEGTGFTAHDLGEGKNHGTITGATWKDESECENGKCLYFNGLNQTRVEADTQDNMSSFTACAWIKAKSLTNIDNDSQINIFTKGWHLLLLNSGLLKLEIPTSSSYSNITTVNSVNIDEWYRVCGVYYGIGIAPKIFLNGNNQQASIQNIGSGSKIDDSTINLYIGSSSNIWGGNFYGYIDDPKIYNYALTAEQVKQDYNGGAVNFR